MDFALTDEQRMIADTANAFFAEGATSARTRAAMDAGGLDRELWRAFCGELGLGGIAVPEARGGAGLGMVEFALVAMAAGERVAAIPLLGHIMATRAMRDDARAPLAACLAGDAIATAGEADGEVIADDSSVTAIADFVPHGAVADHLLLLDGGRGWRIALGGPGVTVEPRATMDATRPYARIALDRAPAHTIPPDAVRQARAAGLLCLAAEATGGTQAALDATVAYTLERQQFGRPIGSFQAIKHRLADRKVDLEQARSAIYWAACSLDEGTSDAGTAVHAAKAFCADAFTRMAADMLQLHGGIGFTWEHDTHLYFKRARAIAAMMGSSAWHREQVAAALLDRAA
ncbi:acyl-CoA dehydrogenase family protein [Sphingomonas sp.]|uniref:acyl-CoA dehydrogenase family protein n=1 Tax=Sphingomonas sp. TaxID=28214 RepID=UPI001EC2FA65|nr:acyl-CoA dehydrogenase family protein [Sphingomonas sp.]MBX3594716.1 acyl-CoA/acyl-ACP dehydrogenase [Sphingomonas sp.]